MPLVHFTARHAVQVLATESRRSDLSPYDLSRVHRELGRYLAYEVLERLELEPCEIRHPQGLRPGQRVARESEIVLLALMRAGLYVTEGVREVLRQAAVYHVESRRARGLDEAQLQALPALAGRVVLLIDSVINTGATLRPVLSQLRARGAGRVLVLSLVTPVDTAEALAREWPEVTFLMARLSTNQYTGVGATDTGNRLFGTLDGGGAEAPRAQDAGESR